MRATFDQKLVTASGFLIFCSIAACIVGAMPQGRRLVARRPKSQPSTASTKATS